MKTSIALLLIPGVHAGTNKTLSPTPGVRRPTPFPTDIDSTAPTLIVSSPFPTIETPAPQPVVLTPTTARPQGMSMSVDYIIDGFSSSKTGKGSTNDSHSGNYDFANHFGRDGKSGKTSGKSGKGSGKSGKNGKSGKGSKSNGKSGKNRRHYDGEYDGYYHALRK